MNFIDFIEVELKLLHKESSSVKQIHNRIGKLIEQIVLLKERNKQNDKNNQQSDAVINEVMRVMLLMHEVKNSKLTLLALDVMRKIMNFKYLQKRHYEQILSHLIMLKGWDDEKVQEKVMQICQYLLIPRLLNLQDCEFIIKLSASRQPFTQKLATSALLQLTEIIYERERYQHYTEEEVSKSLALLNQFVSHVVEGKPINWVPKNMTGIVWDLMLEIVRYQGETIQKKEELMLKFNQLSTIITKKCFTTKIDNKFDFLRYFRAFIYLTVYLKIGIKSLPKMEPMLQTDRTMASYVSLQAIIYVLTCPQVCYLYDSEHQLIKCYDFLSKKAEALCLEHEFLTIGNKKVRHYLNDPAIRLTISENQQFNDDSIECKAIIQCLFSIRTMYELQIQKEDIRIKRSIDRLVPYLIKAYRFITGIEVQEDTMRKCVMQFQMWYRLCAKNKLNKTKNRFLDELAVMAKKMNNRPQAIKSTQSIQVMFNLIYGFQDLLDTSSLSIILQCLMDVQQEFVQKKKKDKQWEMQVGYEMQSVIHMINNLYDANTIHLNEKSIKTTVQALHQVTLSITEQLSEPQPDQNSLKMKTFGVRKMKTVIENNSQHIMVVWDFIVAHFLSVCSCKSYELREQAVKILSETISEVMVKNVIPSEKLLSIYEEVAKVKFLDVKLLVVSHLKTFLTDYSSKMSENSIVAIVKILKFTGCQSQLAKLPPHSREHQEILKLMEAENQLNQILVKQCLACITNDNCLKEFIENYRIIENNKNYEYSGVGLLWIIADHVKKLWLAKHQETYDETYRGLMNKIFGKLQKLVLTDNFAEVRQSAIHILTQIIAQHMKLYERQELETILNDVYFAMFDKVIEKYLQYCQGANESQQKQWQQTSESILANFIKLIKRLKAENVLKDDYLVKILKVIDLCLDQTDKQTFYFKTLAFLRELKTDVLQKMQFEVDSSIKQKLKRGLEIIDRKDRINKAKVIPELQTLHSCYGLSQ